MPGITGPGGGDTGAVLLSPYIRGGTVTAHAYNHYTMLRSVEDLFGLRHIGYAGLPGGRSFGADIFACGPRSAPVARRGRLPAGSEFTSPHIVGRGTHRYLALHAVGAPSLTVTVRVAHRRSRTFHRTLSPCRTYVYALPHTRHAVVSVAAAPVSGGAERVTLRF